jgi:hypothetical protein
MPKTTKPEETGQAGGARRDARGTRDTAASEAASGRTGREPRAAGRATASPPASQATTAKEETGLQPSPADARPDPAPSREQIAQRAYEIYQQRGGGEGQEMDDWIRAEQELKEGRGRRQDET